VGTPFWSTGRAEDGLLMTFIELALLLLYICVLLIKNCDLQSPQVSAEVSTIAVQAVVGAMCRGYGFGDSASGASNCEPTRTRLSRNR
jgi:hypothetical protein